MKKKLLIMLAVITVVLSLMATVANAEIVYKKTIRGSSDSTLCYYYGDNNTLIICGTGVMSDWISNAAYGPWCYDADFNVQKVIIEEGATTIGGGAFWSCTNLETIYVPTSMSIIGDAFQNCSGITDIYYAGTESQWRRITINNDAKKAFLNANIHYNVAIPCGINLTWSLDDLGTLTISGDGDMLPYIDQTALPWYSSIDNIKSVVINDGVKSIGESSFANCANLENVVMPSSITSISTKAFINCTSLKSIVIPNGVKEIGEQSFYNCSNLESIAIPESVELIRSSAFRSCTALKNVYIKDIAQWCKIGFWSYESNPMNGGANLYLNGILITDLVIPKGITQIKYCTFYGCNSIESVTIPKGVEIIGQSSFCQCSNLKKVLIPTSVTDIYNNSFYGCSMLQIVLYGGNEEDWNNIAIEYGNTSLNGKIQYNSAVYPPRTITLQSEPEITLLDDNGTTQTFEITVEQPYVYSYVYVAIYDEDGNFVGVKYIPLEIDDTTTVEIEKNNTNNSVKFFTWTDELQPITATTEIELTQ